MFHSTLTARFGMLLEITPIFESGEFQLVTSGSFSRINCSPLGFVRVITNEPSFGDRRTTAVLLPTVSSMEKNPVNGSLVLMAFTLLNI